jgi:hypothetical protein
VGTIEATILYNEFEVFKERTCSIMILSDVTIYSSAKAWFNKLLKCKS